MASARREEVKEKELQGFRKLKLILPMLSSLHDCAVERDRGKRRELHFDQYGALLLLYFFNPIVTSLRGMQQASTLKKVQRKLGCKRASLGSLSDAARVFDPELLLEVIGELREKLPDVSYNKKLKDIDGIITLVDGTLLRALPKLTEAMWLDETHCSFKGHTQYELLKGVPSCIEITSANTSERDVLAGSLQPGRVYAMDRGYAAFWLFQAIKDAKSSFVCRVRDNSIINVIEDRVITDDAAAADVVSDQIVKLGGTEKGRHYDGPMRLIQIKCTAHKKRGVQHQNETMLVATDLMDVDADVIALIYRQRWQIEIFFRFFKHVLGCRHLLSQSENGVRIQTYVGIIVCMLISLWTGKKPTLRTIEMLQFYFCGMVDDEEMEAHLARLQKHDA